MSCVLLSVYPTLKLNATANLFVDLPSNDFGGLIGRNNDRHRQEEQGAR